MYIKVNNKKFSAEEFAKRLGIQEPIHSVAVFDIDCPNSIVKGEQGEVIEPDKTKTADGKKIIYLHGLPYSISVPTGGLNTGSANNDWDRALSAGCELEWQNAYSWCLETTSKYIGVVRGFETPRHWGTMSLASKSEKVGFRPVLTPLNPKTLKPNHALYSELNGQRIKLGNGYYMSNGEVGIDGGSESLNTVDSFEWFVFEGKLIAVRNLANNISWNTLKELGYVPSAC